MKHAFCAIFIFQTRSRMHKSVTVSIQHYFEYIQQKKKIYLKNFCYNKSIKR